MKVFPALLALSLGYIALSTATPLKKTSQSGQPKASIACKPTGTRLHFDSLINQGPQSTACTVDNGGVKLLSDIEVRYRCFNGVCPSYPTLSWRIHWPVSFYSNLIIRFANGMDCTMILDNIAQYCTGDRCSKDITEYQFPQYDRYGFEITASGNFPVKEYTDKCQMSPSFVPHPTNPGPIASPRIEKTSRTGYRVHFDKPATPNGNIDYYHVVQYDAQSVRQDYRFPAYYTETGIGVQCVNDQTPVGLYIAVAAVNRISNGTEYEGPLSEWKYLEFCKTACPECTMDLKN